jgi:hypothetical protein
MVLPPWSRRTPKRGDGRVLTCDIAQLPGLGDEQTVLRDSALIMINSQNTYRRGVMRLEGAEDAFAAAEASRLLDRARASGVPVFPVMHDADQGSPYDITAEIGQINRGVAPDAEPVGGMPYPSSFCQVGLDGQLEKASYVPSPPSRASHGV